MVFTTNYRGGPLRARILIGPFGKSSGVRELMTLTPDLCLTYLHLPLLDRGTIVDTRKKRLLACWNNCNMHYIGSFNTRACMCNTTNDTSR